MDEALRATRGDTMFLKAKSGWTISSCVRPEIDASNHTLYVRGASKKHDNEVFWYQADTEETAKVIYDELADAVTEFAGASSGEFPMAALIEQTVAGNSE